MNTHGLLKANKAKIQNIVIGMYGLLYEGSPPNNWLSVFGGSAWQWCKHRNQFYLHNFLTSQPDLNFHNPEVQAQMLDEIKFWLDVGVDGFRFDVINFLFHDHRSSNPPKDPKLVRPLGFNKDNPMGCKSIFMTTRPEMLPYLEKIRRLLDEYDAISLVKLLLKTHFQPSENTPMNKGYIWHTVLSFSPMSLIMILLMRLKNFHKKYHRVGLVGLLVIDSSRIASRIARDQRTWLSFT